MNKFGFQLSFGVSVLLVLNSVSQIAGQCYVDSASAPIFSFAIYYSSNLTFDSTATCINNCSSLGFSYAAIEDASFCWCSRTTTGLTAASTCTVSCVDGNACGGPTPGVISVYSTSGASNGDYNITFSLDKTSVAIATVITATVNASPANFTINWGDGSTPVENALTHSYNLPGVYTVTASLWNNQQIQERLVVTVSDTPSVTMVCPTILQLGIAQPCNVTSLRQGFDYNLTWSLTNTSTVQEFTAHVPAEITTVYGHDSLTTDSLTSGALATGTLVVFPNSQAQGGGYVVRIRTNAAAAGTVGIYSITPQCSSNAYCGVSEACSASCDVGVTHACSSSLCSPAQSCTTSYCSSQAATNGLYSLSLLTTVAVTTGVYSYDLPTPVYLPIGTMLGYGCDTAASCGTAATIYSRPFAAFETSDLYLLNVGSSSFAVPTTVFITQIEVRQDPIVNINVTLLCQAAAPIATSAVPTPFSSSTEQYVYKGNLNFTFNLNSPTVNIPQITQQSLLCQQNISTPTLIPQIWIPFGTPYTYTVSFSQGSPLYSIVNTGSTTLYDYYDNALAGYDMPLSLTYSLEGLYTLQGNTSNALGFVLFDSIIHVVPLITNTWTLTIICPCLDISVGFPFNLNFPSAAHPPWNATFEATYELGTLFPKQNISFGTYGTGGAATSIPISKTAVVLTDGTYTATVTLQNDVSNTTIIQTFTVKAAIRDVTAFMQWNNSGIIMDGLGAAENIFLTNFTMFIYPSCRTGIPDMWRLTINETGQTLTTADASGSFSLTLPKDSYFTITISGYNSVQGWVSSPPIKIQTVSTIQGYVLTDNGVITAPGQTRNLIGTFVIYTPLSCILIDFGDGSTSETYGYFPLCSKTYPSSLYREAPLTSPITMPHVYQKNGVYTVMSVAFDDEVSLSQSVSVVVGNIPCTMPNVVIFNNTKISNSIPTYWKSLHISFYTNSSFQCNTSTTVNKWWTISEINPTTLVSVADIVVQPIPTWSSSQLAIPPAFLPYGTYVVTCYLSVNVTSAGVLLTRSDYTYMAVVPSPLQPIVIAGSISLLKRGYGQIVLLDPGSLSTDPDFPNDNTHVSFKWWCQQLSPALGTPLQIGSDGRWILTNVQIWPTPAIVQNRTGGGCFGIENGALSVGLTSIYFNTVNFINPIATYQFILEMNRANRTAYTTLNFQLVLVPPPTINLGCPPNMCYVSGTSLVINPSVRLALNGSCSAGCTTNMTYHWTILSAAGAPVNLSTAICGTSGSGGTVITTAPPTCNPTFKTGMNSTDIAIDPIFFANNPSVKSYRIRLTGDTIDGNEGFAEIVVKENEPPTGGTCYFRSEIGDALLSIYPAVCQNWIDPEQLGIQSYTFYYYTIASTGTVRNTLASVGTPTLNLIMPVGNFSVYVDISDVMQAFTTYLIGNVTVAMPTQAAVTAYDPTKVIAYLSAIGDQASLGMVLIALASVRDNADWLSLDTASLANLTQAEIMARIAAITNMNDNQLKNAIANLDFATLGQLDVGGKILQSALSGVFANPLGPYTVDMSTRADALALLQKMANQIPSISIPDPHQLEPFLSNTMDAMSSLIKGINVVLSQNTMVPPTDQAAAVNLDYNTDITGLEMTIPTDPSTMLTQNVLDTTKIQAEAQIAQIFSIINQIAADCIAKMVNGETVTANSPNGGSIVIAKLNEGILVNGLTISAGNSAQAQIIFAHNFCPSHYVLKHTNCRQDLALLATIWPTITHIYPDTSSLLSNTTKVIDVAVNISGAVVAVENETNPIILNIPRDVESLPNPTYVNVSDYSAQKFIYHYFNVTNKESAYTIEITPAGKLPHNMILLLDHERMPTPSLYLMKVQISSLPVNANGTYSLFVSSNVNANKTGRFFGGIGILQPGIAVSSNVTLTSDNFVTSFPVDYSFRIYLSGCYYFDNMAMAWSGTGLSVVQATPSMITCAAYHLTPFGCGFFPEPNLINFDYVFAHAGFIDNSTLYAVLIVLISWYTIMMIWAHFMDRKDIEKIGVIPLPDNDVQNKYLFEVTFTTGPDKEATTDSKIYFIASGDYGETEIRLLPPPTNHLYRRFAVNTFVMAVPKPLGHINFLRVFHDNSGEPPLDSWQLQMVVFRDLQTNEISLFDVNSWLALDRDEGQVDKIFTSAENEDEKSFSQNMYIQSNRTANQDHIWMGPFLRPPTSRFGRKERVSVCAAFLYLSMIVSALWYNKSDNSARGGYFNYGPFTLSSEQMIMGTCVLLIVYPFVYALCLIFKRARPRKLKRCRALDAIEKQREAQLLDTGVGSEEASKDCQIEIDASRSPKIKQKSPIRCIPWWTRIIAWLLIFVSIVGSVLLVWAYGIMWGEIKTVKWFSTFILAFTISILVAQWLKVILVAMIASSICKTNLSAEDIDCDEELPALKHNEEWSHMKFVDQGMRKKVHKVEGVNIENPEVATIRMRMMKDRESGSTVKGILVYCLFLAIIYTIMSGRTSYNTFLLQDHFRHALIKQGDAYLDYTLNVQTTSDWWYWAENVILQKLRAQRQYNNAPPYGLRGFMDDQANRMLGYAIIRQIRGKRYNCAASSPMDQMIPHCSGVRGIMNEETRDFCAGWTLNETFTGACKYPQFQYLTASQLQTYMVTGTLGYYSGGGYVLQLSGDQGLLLAKMADLQKNFWVDRNTRALIIEWSIYNANVNLFSTCQVMAEFSEGGGITASWRFQPLQLIQNTGLSGYVANIAEVLFVITIIIFTLKELWEIKNLKLMYFASNWNLAEIIILLIAYTAIGLYFYRSILTNAALTVFQKTNGNGYVRIDSAAVIDQYFLYCIGAIVFFSTLKLIKLLQFNKRMNVLALTIKKCWDELKIFLIAFAIIFFGFTCIFFFMFTSNVKDFAEIVSAILCSFKMMLGKFDFQEMNDVNPWSPILFFVFSLVNSMILINIMLTIIICAFNDVKIEISKQENRLNVIDFVWSSFKQFIRKENLYKINVTVKLTDKKNDKHRFSDGLTERESDQLPDKVSQLLKHINDFYFDGQLNMNDPEAKKSLMAAQLHDSSKSKFRDPKKFGKRNVIKSDE